MTKAEEKTFQILKEMKIKDLKQILRYVKDEIDSAKIMKESKNAKIQKTGKFWFKKMNGQQKLVLLAIDEKRK
jgi:uncharacterized protein (DUF952 family)